MNQCGVERQERFAWPGLSSTSATAAAGTACCWLESRPTRHCDGQSMAPTTMQGASGARPSLAPHVPAALAASLAAVALVEPDYKVKVFWDATNPPDDPNFSQEVRRGLGLEWQVDREEDRAGGGAEERSSWKGCRAAEWQERSGASL